MVKVVGMVPDRFTNRGGAANEINGKDLKSGELEDSYQKGQEEQGSTGSRQNDSAGNRRLVWTVS